MGKIPSIHIHRPLRRSNLRPGVRAQGHMLIISRCHLIIAFQPASFDLPKSPALVVGRLARSQTRVYSTRASRSVRLQSVMRLDEIGEQNSA